VSILHKTFIILFVIALVAFVGLNLWPGHAEEESKTNYPIQKTDAEWKAELSPEAYRILRKHDTERPNSSPLNKVKEPGDFVCAGCGQTLFQTAHKFDSGTGWPSFYQPASASAVGTTKDYKLLLPRTEVHCSRCGGHLGHVFGDGPKPTGKRYCINGAALDFEPEN